MRANWKRSGLAACTGLALSAAAAWAQPANNACSSASVSPIPSAGGTVVGTNVLATNDGTGCGGTGGMDVYHAWTPNANGPWKLSMCTTSPAWDSVISIHTGCPTAPGNIIAGSCVDDICGNQAELASITLSGGTPYIVRISTYSSGFGPPGGPYNLVVSNLVAPGRCCAPSGICTLSAAGAAGCSSGTTFTSGGVCSPNTCPQPAGNDECDPVLAASGAPYAFTGSGFSVSGTTVGATNSPGTSLATCGLTGGASSTNPATKNDLYYKFTPDVSNLYTVSLCGTPVWDSVLSVHDLTGGTCPTTAGNQISCNDDGVCMGGIGLSAITDLGLNGGSTYIIRVAVYTSGTPNIFTLNVSSDPFGRCCSADGLTCTFVTQANCGSSTWESGITCSTACPVPPPANDDCFTAAVISALPYASGPIGIGGALGDIDVACNSSSAFETNNGIWFTYTPSVTCSATFTQGGSADGVTAVFAASDCNALGAELVCSDPVTSFYNLVGGQTYKILVGIYSATPATGTSTLSFAMDCVPPPPPPTNDTCAGAALITTLPFDSGPIVVGGATSDPALSCNTGGAFEVAAGIWFSYTPASDCIATLGETGSLDAIHGVYTGGCVSLGEVQCFTTDAGNSFAATGGTTYYILTGVQGIAGAGASSALTVTLDCVPPPANDVCSGAIHIPAVPYTVPAPISLNAATDDEFVLPDGTCNAGNTSVLRGVWFSYSATADGFLQLREQSSLDSVMALFSGGCSGLTFIGCSDGTPATGDEFYNVGGITAGTTYYMLVGKWGTSAPGAGSVVNFSLDFIPAPAAPANDTCASGMLITSLPFSSGAIGNGGATADANGSCNTGGATQVNSGIWFTYTPAADCSFIYSETTAQDSVMVVFTGDCNALGEVHCTVDEANAVFAATAGTTYHILVGRQGAATANPTDTLNVSLDCVAPPSGPPANDLCSSATVISSFPFDSGSIQAYFATNDLDVSCNSSSAFEAQQGVWFTWTATAGCNILSLNETDALDTVTTVFTGDCAGGLGEVYCSDPESSTLTGSEGTQYFILVSRFSTTPLDVLSSYRLTATCVVPTTGDECDTTDQIAVMGTQFGSTIGSSTSFQITPGSLCPGIAAPASTGFNDVFYKFTAPATATYTINTCGTATLDTVLSIHSGPCSSISDSSSVLACNDDAGYPVGVGVACPSNTLASRILTVNLVAGTQYHIRIAAYLATSRGEFTLNIAYVNEALIGSCCSGSACTLADPAGCVGGTHTVGGSCQPTNPCGVTSEFCCRGTTCVSVSAGTCVGTVNGTTALVTTSCGAGNSTSSCCFADYSHTNGLTIDDLFLYLNGYFASSPYANMGGDGVTAPNIDDLFLYINAYFNSCQP